MSEEVGMTMAETYDTKMTHKSNIIMSNLRADEQLALKQINQFQDSGSSCSRDSKESGDDVSCGRGGASD